MASRFKFSPKLIIGILIAIFFGVSLFIRIHYPYDQVFVGDWIKYTGNDAYYQMRLVDNMSHNFPHITSFDPYLIFPGGASYGNIHFFNWFLAFIVWIGGLGSPTQHTVDMIGVYFPVVLAALTVIPVYFIGKALFNRWAGVIAAGLVAVLPGEFVGRSLLGGTDQHVAEVLFTAIAAMFVIYAIKTSWQNKLSWAHVIKRDWKVLLKPLIFSVLGGLFLGIYLITWLGGMLYVFIFALFFIVQFIIDHMRGQSTFYLGFTGFLILLVASAIFLPLSPAIYLSAAVIIALLLPPVLTVISKVISGRGYRPYFYPVALVAIAAVFLVIFNAVRPDLMNTMLSQFSIFNPGGATGTTTIEMRPFLSPQGSFNTAVAWGNFTTSFFLIPGLPIPGIAFISFVVLVVLFIKQRSDEKHLLLFFIWSLVILVATLTQRRFAYYLVVNIAVLSGYLGWQIIWLLGIRRRNPETAESNVDKYKRARIIGILGCVVAFLLSGLIHQPLYFFLPVTVLGFAALLYGCWAWAKLKGKGDLWALWGILGPIGLVVLAFSQAEKTKDKTKKRIEEKSSLPLYGINIAIVIVMIFSLLFWTNYNKSKEVAAQAAFAPSDGWEESLHWMRDNTPEPMDPDAYYALYDKPAPGEQFNYPDSAYGVTAWWDYGYWIMRTARRIPSANPSQAAGPIIKVANLLLSRDDAKTREIVTELDSSYIIIDYAVCVTKLWAVSTWAGMPDNELIGTYYVAYQGSLVPVQVFNIEYYQSLCIRLYNFDGKASTGEKPMVLNYQNKTDGAGKPYRQITDAEEFNSYKEAQNYVNSQPSGNFVIVGSNPFITPIPLEEVTDYKLIYSSNFTVPISDLGTISEIKIFEYLGK